MDQAQDVIGWFESWDRMQNVAIGAIFFYAFIVLLVRILGKRTTSQMNNFDWIITIAVGSLAASGILLRDIAIIEAVAAIVILAAAQWFTTWLVLRSKLFSRVVKAEPTLLTHKGEYLEDAMKRMRISKEEIASALRQHGMTQLSDANWVILETNGEMTVIPQKDTTIDDVQTMADVGRPQSLPN